MDRFQEFKEIANPKIKNGKLVSSFRLETLMQDIAYLFNKEEVGVTSCNKILAETSAKNDLLSGKEKQLIK